MVARIEPNVSGSAVAARRLALFVGVLALTALLAHRTGRLETVAFLAVLALVLLLALAAIVLWVAGFRRVWYGGDRGGGSLAVGAVVLALVLAPFGVAAFRAATTPALVDVSSDPDDPPDLPIAKARRAPPMNPVSEQTPEERLAQAQAYPEVTGHRYTVPAERVMDAVLALVTARGWRLVNPMPDALEGADTLIEATAMTRVLSLPVDVAIRLTDEDNATYVDMRSASRYGPHDLGDNAARISSFLADLDRSVANDSGTAPPQ